MNAIIGFLTMATLWVGGIAAWVTSIVHCIANEKIAMLFIDGFIPPIGVIHGITIWFSG